MDITTNRRNLLCGATAGAFVLGLGASGAAGAKPTAAPPSPAEVSRYAEALLAKAYAADKPGAAVLVARGDQVLFRGARGLADLEAKTPLKGTDLFRIGSVTKQMSAAGLLKLVEMGKVKLDDPLTKFVPGYPNGDAITVLMLLNHTSGIRSYTGMPGYMETEIHKDLTTAQMIAVFKDQPADFAPGARWAYNNSGYVLVGAVIEAASGMAWHAWLDKALFQPLGMRDTGYGHDPKFNTRQVKGYTQESEGGPPVPMRILSMTQPHAAGAIVSTVDDLHRWNRGLHEGRVLGATYQQMITPVGVAAPASYGFGIGTSTVRTNPSLQHNGGIFGFASSLSYLPGPDITVAVLENDDADNTGDSADAIVRKLAAFALGDPYPEVREVPVDAATLKAAEAVYLFDGGVRRILRVVDGRLTGQRDQGRQTPLTPIGPDEYVYEDGFNRLKLERNAAGAITGMRFWPSGDGDGVVGARTNEPLPAAAVAAVVPRAALERLLGTYEGPGGLSLRVYIEGEALKGQLTGQPPVNLRAISPTEFAVDEANARVVFQPGEAPAADLVIRQGGQEIPLKRKP